MRSRARRRPHEERVDVVTLSSDQSNSCASPQPVRPSTDQHTGRCGAIETRYHNHSSRIRGIGSAPDRRVQDCQCGSDPLLIDRRRHRSGGLDRRTFCQARKPPHCRVSFCRGGCRPTCWSRGLSEGRSREPPQHELRRYAFSDFLIARFPVRTHASPVVDKIVATSVAECGSNSSYGGMARG